jgi:hypothetical protein
MRRIGMSELASSSLTLVAADLFDRMNRHDLAETRPYDHPDVVEDFTAVGQSRGLDEVLGFFSDRGDDASWRV